MLDLLDNEIPVGIDLGTTNSCIGYWDGKEVKIVPNRIGERTTPSIIYLYNNQFIIGEEILKDINLKDKSEKIYSIKRIIGQDFNDIGLEEEVKNLHYNIIKDESTNRPLIKLKRYGKDENLTPEFLSSLILQKLVNNLKKLVAKAIEKVVISVPAYFDDAQRSATIEAAKLAGLTVIRIINEPTAAALSYGLGQNFCPIKNKIQCFSTIFKKNRDIRASLNSGDFISNNSINNNIKDSYCEDYDKENIKKLKNSLMSTSNEKAKNVMVFDLGGGTFDLAILKLNIDQKEYEVKSKYSDKHLGGDDFDNKLVEYCLNNFNLDIPKDKIDKKAKERLKKACEYAKKFLSQQYDIDDDIDDDNVEDQAKEDIQAIIRIDNFVNGKDFVVPITKSQFENEICSELFDRLTKNFGELIKGAELNKKDINEIILVGGSTKMPKVKKLIKEYFKDCNIKINDEINPDEVVAFGATIQAAMLMSIGKNSPLKNVKLLDITPISLGTDVLNKSNKPKIKALGNQMSVIIPKWTRIPTSKQKEYQTVKDYQDSMQICIFEGENDYLKDNKMIGKLILPNLSKKPKGEVKCIVNFEINASSILTVNAYEESESKRQSTKIELILNKNKKMDNNNKNVIYNNKNIIQNSIKINDKKIQNLLQKYEKYKNNNKEQIKVLEDLCDEIRKIINEFNPEEMQEKINENNIEIYFYNVYQLLECLEEILYLNEDDKNNEKYINEIKKYINIFKKQSTYYIKQIIDLFKGARSEIFLNILQYSIEQLNETGKNYFYNKQKYSRYYAKLYFEEIIRIYKKYIKLKLFKSDIDEIITNCEHLLQNINSNAISLIYISTKKKQLIDSSNQYQIMQWGDERKDGGEEKKDGDEPTFWTYYESNINPNQGNLTLSNEDYNLILDELNKIKDLISIKILNIEEGEIKNHLIEEKGICLGNIVKIKFIYQKGENYKKYKQLIDDSVECGEQCNKNINNCIWYKEAIELKKQLEEIIKQINNNNDEIIKIEIRDKLDEIDSCFDSVKEKGRFINLILEEYPYDGFNKNEFDEKFSIERIDLELIDFLSKKYFPDNYPKDTKEEKKRYYIMENICQKLNSLLQDYKNK